MKNKSVLALAVLLAAWMTVMACPRKTRTAARMPWYEDEKTLAADYADALADASAPDSTKLANTLMPVLESNPELEWITVDGRRMVLVCALMNQNKLKKFAAADTFRLDKETGTWVTLPQEWKRCADRFADMDSVAARFRMIQILGLWRDCDYDTVVEFYVEADMLFRPSFDPSVTTTGSGAGFPSWADEHYTVGETNFREWFAYQQSVAYVGDYACPWTQLGYTYDWHHGAPRQGLSEYIATVGALALVKTRMGAWTFIRSQMPVIL